MANDNLCVFCGQKPGTFRSTTVACGNTVQVSCKACEKELKDLDEMEVCRRALIRGIAENPDRIRERIELLSEAENHRPKCLRCGSEIGRQRMSAAVEHPEHYRCKCGGRLRRIQ